MRPNFRPRRQLGFRQFLRGGAAALLALGIAGPQINAQSVEALEFEVDSIGGRTLRHKDFERNVLLVDYWGTWCPPCREAVPVLQSLYTKYKHHGLEIVGFTYEGGTDKDPVLKVRDFAIKNGVTYPLALGTPALKRMVKGLSAYPTLLFFRRGLAFDHAEEGFVPARGDAIEDWVRDQLGLPPLERDVDEVIEADDEDEAAAAAAPAAAQQPDKPKLPAGTVFQPGDGDTGFAFSETDLKGDDITFAELRGKPVLLAMTSTWDASATATAALLKKVQESHGETAHIIAASLELPGSAAQRKAKVIEFQKKHGVTCRSFLAGVGFQKKVHLFSGMPMFLVFDQNGVLTLRESGVDADKEAEHQLDATYEKIADALGR